MTTISFDIKARFGGAVLFTAQIEVGEETSTSVRMGLAIRAAHAAGAYLGGADLRGAYLGGADLRGAYLGGADLRGADLGGADLRGAYLRGAYLGGAYLGGADLGGAVVAEGVTIEKTPIQIQGLEWDVTIFDAHMRIGCQFHSLADWASFDDARIDDMASKALVFWRANKDMLLGLARASGRV